VKVFTETTNGGCQGNFLSVTPTYIGDPGRIYINVSVDGQTLSPVPGVSYDIEDPGDGRWEGSGGAVAPPVGDSEPSVSEVVPDTPEGT
jgi:hypothetical protein